jgi:hypothetical protein
VYDKFGEVISLNDYVIFCGVISVGKEAIHLVNKKYNFYILAKEVIKIEKDEKLSSFKLKENF